MSFPASPVLNEVFIADGKAWKYDGTNWVIPKKGLPEWDEIRFKPEYFDAKVISSDAPPTNQVEGTLWWDRLGQRLFVYNGAAWVEQNDSFPAGDLDVWNYVLRVQGADGQALETPVIGAIGNFIMGCKADGIWDAIKASCILAGARSLEGALVPLKGTDPTNINFMQADYDRKLGLIGDGSNKSINTNRNNNTDPQDSKHASVYITSKGTIQSGSYIGGALNSGSTAIIIVSSTTINTRLHGSITTQTAIHNVGFMGVSRNNASNYSYRNGNVDTIIASPSVAPISETNRVFANNNGANANNSRLSFYSIGESIDLVKLNNRVSALMADFNALIP